IATGSDNSEPAYFTPLNDQVVFVAGPSNDRDLYISDGTASGTHLLKDFSVGFSQNDHLYAFNGAVYFAAQTEKGDELWITNGTTSGTKMPKDINQGSA